jgi:hypothetical protein
MRKFCLINLLCLVVLLLGASTLTAQTSEPDPAPVSDSAITRLSVMGVVTDLKQDVRQVFVITAAGNQVTVTLGDRTVFMRIPPGEKMKDKFIKITAADFVVGDTVFARGRMTSDRRNLPALEFYVMSKSDMR